MMKDFDSDTEQEGIGQPDVLEDAEQEEVIQDVDEEVEVDLHMSDKRREIDLDDDDFALAPESQTFSENVSLDSVDEEDKKSKHTKHVPDLRYTDSLSSYLRKIKDFPMLTAEEEHELANRWQHHQDPSAKEKIINSHLRLVAKIAAGYKGYGMSLNDLISEGHIGMMQALNKFDPTQGARFSTYSTWWVKAAIKNYVMGSWSLVKTGTTASQKKLFFRLRKERNKLLERGQKYLTKDQIGQIAEMLEVPEKDVREMENRMSGGDYSLNTRISISEDNEWQDWLADEKECHSDTITYQDELSKKSNLLHTAMQSLRPRELTILMKRRLEDPPLTLEQVSVELNLSRERVRQIEAKAFEKLQKRVRNEAQRLQIN